MFTKKSQRNANFALFCSERLSKFVKIAANCDFQLIWDNRYIVPKCLSQTEVAQGIQNAVVIYRGGCKVSLLLQ